MSAYPGYMDDIPEPDQAYYEQISGGFDDAIYCEPPHAHTPTRPQNQAVYRLDAFDILSRASHELTAIAANCGIDWQALSTQLNSSQGEYKANSIALDKNYRGAVKAWLEIKTARNGQQYPVLTFHTVKHGGVSEQFNGYQWLKDSGLVNAKPLSESELKAIQANRAERDQQQAKKAELATQKQAAEQNQTLARFNDFQKLFDTLPAITDTAGTYLELKGFTAENFSSDFINQSGLILKRGKDKDGGFIAYALKNNHKIVGYQKLYDKPVTWLNGNKYGIYKPDSKNGSFAIIGKPENLTDKIYLVEGFATGLSVYLAAGKPVIIALDAGNLFHVAESQSKIFKNLTIAADNDIKALGNTGLYNALITAKAFNLDIVYPVLASGEKCDFNDLHVKHGLKEVKSQLKSNKLDFSESSIYYNLLLNYCPVQNKANLEKHLKSACFIAANQLLLNNADDIKNAALSIQAIIDNRELAFNAESQIKWFLDKKLFEIKKANSIVNLENIVTYNCTGKNNAEIAQLIRQHKKSIWIDTRPMGTGKTELMQVIADAAKSKKGIDTQITYIAHRTALIKDASNRLSLRYYEDVAWYMGERPSTLATTANSILNHAVSDYVKILFIDEVRQTLEHILNGTCDNRLEVFNQLIAAIKKADLVLCADADLNQFTIDWLKSIANKPLRMIASDTLKLDKKIIELDTNGALFGKIREDLLSCQNTWITTDSMSKAKNITEFLSLESDNEISAELNSLFNDNGLNLDIEKDILLITSENKADIKQALFLANPNEESKKYRVIIHTPVISSGVSVTNGHFNSVYAIFCNVTAPNEMLQTIARVRTAKEIYCTFKTGHIKNRATNIKDLIDGESIKRSRFSNGDIKGLDYFDKLRLNQIVNKNQALNDFKPYFFLLAGQKGYDVLPENKNGIESESEKQLNANLKKISSIVKMKEISVIKNDTDIINSNEAIKLDKLNALTQQQTNALKRYKVCQWTGKDSKENALNDITELDIDFVVFNKGSSIIANYELLAADLEDLKQSDNDNFSFRDKLASKTSKHLLFKTVIDGINGLKDGLFDSATAGKICEFLRDHHKELASNGLGNYAKVSRYPVKQLTEFLAKCGYDVELVKKGHDNVKWFSIMPNEQVKGYADARAYQRKLKNIDTDM
jgi:phage/plasmid primase-like uncharacterized protein